MKRVRARDEAWSRLLFGFHGFLGATRTGTETWGQPTASGRAHRTGAVTRLPAVRFLQTMNPVQPSSRASPLAGHRRRDTRPELNLRSLLHRAGLRSRADDRVGSGRSAPRPDIAFIGPKVAVVVDGCFWHCCPKHGSTPGVHQDYWPPKLARNVERDTENTEALRRMGWTVVRVWEHEDTQTAAKCIEALVRGPE